MTATTTDTATWFLPLRRQSGGAHRQSALAAEALIEALFTIPEPMRLSFLVSMGGDTPPECGLVVGGFDPTSSRELAREVADIANALSPWQSLGEIEPWAARPKGPSRYQLRAVAGPGRRLIMARSAAWALAAERDTRTTMLVDLLGPSDDEEQRSAVMRVSVSGTGMTPSTVAALVASETAGPVRLESVPSSDASCEMVLPISTAAQLLSTASRIEDAWPDALPTGLEEVLVACADAVPPHNAWFGGSGLGKTTLLEHQIAESMKSGNRVVVLCPHGDLSGRARELALRAGVAHRYFDFADRHHSPTWNLTNAPDGVEPDKWALTLYQVVRNAWEDVPEEWFGPVGKKSLTCGLRVLVRDVVDGQSRPITELADLLVPTDKRKWLRVLERIGDESLTADVESVWRAGEQDSNGHFGLWVTSKVEPFVADPGIRRALGERESTVTNANLAGEDSIIMAAPAGELGDAGSNLLIGTMLARLWEQIRSSPTTMPVDLYIDEVQRVPSSVLVAMLTEGRKYGLRVRVAAQNPSLLPGRLRDTLLTNCGAVGSFRLGSRDASLLVPYFPTSTIESLSTARRYWFTVSFGDTEMSAHNRPSTVRDGFTPIATR